MNTLIKADIFFFVATIATVIFVILGSVALVYFIGILRNVKRATDSLRERIETTGQQLDALGEQIAASGIFRMIFGGVGKRRRKVQ